MKNPQPEISDEIYEYIKRIIHCDQVEFIPGVQGWFTIRKSINMVYHSNEMKGKNSVIISMNAEKTLDRIQHSFMIKTQQRGDRRNIPQRNKSHM